MRKGEIVSEDLVRPAATVLGLIKPGLSGAERAVLQAAAMELVDDERFARPVPRFLTELPFGGDADEMADRMAAAVLVAADPDAVQVDNGTTAGKDLVGRPVVVWDLFVLPGVKEGGWGAYLLLDITVDKNDDHIVVNTGAKQAVTRLARLWVDQKLPAKGSFAVIPNTGRQGQPAVTFLSEPVL
jgi:hypothetical protein